MRVVVKSKDANINIKIPMGVVTTLLKIGKPFIKLDFDKNSKASMVNNLFKNKSVDTMIKGLKYLNKQHKGLRLVDIEDSNGDIVKIEI